LINNAQVICKYFDRIKSNREKFRLVYKSYQSCVCCIITVFNYHFARNYYLNLKSIYIYVFFRFDHRAALRLYRKFLTREYNGMNITGLLNKFKRTGQQTKQTARQTATTSLLGRPYYVLSTRKSIRLFTYPPIFRITMYTMPSYYLLRIYVGVHDMVLR